MATWQEVPFGYRLRRDRSNGYGQIALFSVPIVQAAFLHSDLCSEYFSGAQQSTGKQVILLFKVEPGFSGVEPTVVLMAILGWLRLVKLPSDP